MPLRRSRCSRHTARIPGISDAARSRGSTSISAMPVEDRPDFLDRAVTHPVHSLRRSRISRAGPPRSRVPLRTRPRRRVPNPSGEGPSRTRRNRAAWAVFHHRSSPDGTRSKSCGSIRAFRTLLHGRPYIPHVRRATHFMDRLQERDEKLILRKFEKAFGGRPRSPDRIGPSRPTLRNIAFSGVQSLLKRRVRGVFQRLGPCLQSAHRVVRNADRRHHIASFARAHAGVVCNTKTQVTMWQKKTESKNLPTPQPASPPRNPRATR